MHGWVEKAKRDSAGFAGSLLLHLALAAALLVTIAHHRSPPVSPFLNVEIIRLRTETQLPGGLSGPPKIAASPQTQTASPEKRAMSAIGRTPAEDELDAKLKALARLANPTPKLSIDNGTGTDNETAGGGTGEASYGLRDYLRAQILRRWALDLGKLGPRHITVRIGVTLKKNGTITDAVIVGGLPANDALYRDIAIGARNAALLSSPILLPTGDYPNEMHIVITLDTRAVRR